MTAVLTDNGVVEVDARWEAGRLWVQATSAGEILGWEVKPEGLCRADECVLPGEALDGDELDLLAAAALTGRPAVADASADAVVVGTESALRTRAIEALEIPDVSLPTLEGAHRSLRSWSGKKKLFAVFASW